MVQSKKPFRGLVGVGAVLLIILLASQKTVKSNRGVSGVGALIIFIAVILVAAVAASVLISTGGSLQQKALITGNEAREGISSGLEAVSIRGSDASQSGTPHSITMVHVMARLPPGSNPLSFNTTVITLDTSAKTQSLSYGGVVADSIQASGTSDYVVTYVKAGPYQENDYLNTGDLVKIKFNIDGSLGENMRGRVTVIPRAGNINQLEFVTPESMTEPVVVLWPTN